jgi:hypothetical protein
VCIFSAVPDSNGSPERFEPPKVITSRRESALVVAKKRPTASNASVASDFDSHLGSSPYGLDRRARSDLNNMGEVTKDSKGGAEKA